MRKSKLLPVMIIIVLITSTTFLIPVRTEAYLGDRTIKLGMQGYDVIQLQKNLDYLGYTVGSIDGIYGQNTRNAVNDFQRNHGLIVDGIIGYETAMTIIKEVSRPNPGTNRSTSTPSRSSLPLPYSQQDIHILACVVHGEARGEPFEGQVAVAAVVLNRVESQNFGNSVKEVIFEPGAFTAVDDGQFYLQPDSNAYRAVEAALRGWDPSEEALYYWNPVTATNKWIWSRPIVTRIGQHVFAR